MSKNTINKQKTEALFDAFMSANGEEVSTALGMLCIHNLSLFVSMASTVLYERLKEMGGHD